MIRKHYRDIKSIGKTTKLMDHWFMGKYHFSPYMACEHACIYCDGRAEKYYVEGEFERDIVIRRNLPQVLEKKWPTFREKGTFLIGSGISDPYQSVEAKEGLMRACLTQLARTGFAVWVMTKSDLVLRDLDLLETINGRSRCLLMVSLVFPDDEPRRVFEPGASTVEARLGMIRQFKARQIPVCVLAMPLLPGIADGPGSINLLFDKLKALDVDVIMPGGLTLRPGRQKEAYLKVMETHYPGLLSATRHIYRGEYPSGSPEPAYTQTIQPPVVQALAQKQIPRWVPHRIYKNCYPKYDELYILLKHLKELYGSAGASMESLEKADAAYGAWYLEQRTLFNRKRSMTQADLEQKLSQELRTSASPVLGGNTRLTQFMKEAIFGEAVFDYTRLKWE